jgi:hypothetical protein
MTGRHAEQRELEQVESTIAELRSQAQKTRDELGNRDGGSADPGDVGRLAATAEEQEEQIGVLGDRRGKLRERLGLGAGG